MRRTVVTYQLCQGIWNPRDQNYSWVVVDEVAATKPGHVEAGFMLDCYLLGVDTDDPLISRSKVAREAKEARKTYQGPPLVLTVVNTTILEEVGDRREPEIFEEAEAA